MNIKRIPQEINGAFKANSVPPAEMNRMQTESKVQQRDADVTAHISAYLAHTQIIRNVQRMMVLKLD